LTKTTVAHRRAGYVGFSESEIHGVVDAELTGGGEIESPPRIDGFEEGIRDALALRQEAILQGLGQLALLFWCELANVGNGLIQGAFYDGLHSQPPLAIASPDQTGRPTRPVPALRLDSVFIFTSGNRS
jgi:hypothetical protein